MQQLIKLPKKFWEDDKWAHEHYIELQHRFKDKWVAIFNKEVIVVADGPEEAMEQAQKKTGIKEIPVLFVESGKNLY